MMKEQYSAEAAAGLVDDLRKFGLQRSQAAVYLALLAKGPQSQQGLLRLRVAAADKISSSTELLKLLLLVGEQKFRDKTRFYATNPKIAWRWQEFQFVWDRVRKLVPIDSIPLFDDPSANERLALIRRIRQGAMALYHVHQHTSVETGRGRHYPTPDEYAHACAEAISLADRSIVAIDKPPYLTASLPVFWSAITDRRRAGVPYVRCVPLFEIIYHGLDVVERDITEVGVDLRILPLRSIRRTFYLVDTKYLLLKHNHDSSQSSVASLTCDKNKINRYQRYAEQAMAVSRPATDFIQDLRAWTRKLADNVKERYSKSEHCDVVLTLAAMGKFARLSSAQHPIANQLLADGYVQAVDKDRFVLAPPLESRFVSFL